MHTEEQDLSMEKSFAELLEESGMEQDRLRPGHRVDAVIVKITPEWVFLDLGGKTEGTLEAREVMDEHGAFTVQEGDTIRAYFVSAKQNEKLFTTKVTGGEVGRSILEDAWRSRIPVEGLVDKEIKGGFEVRVGGAARAFCPYSQMALTRVENAADFVGQSLTFLIMEYRERGRNIVLSRRPILEEEEKQRREALKEVLQEGMTVQGTVMSVQRFGAFVDIGGIQGLIPASEIGWDRRENIHERLHVGDEVEAMIIRLDWEKGRITLSIKETEEDPWEGIEDRFPGGSMHAGTVVRLTDFGAFVTLEPGVDGLVHISKLGRGKRIKHAKDALTNGQTVEVVIESVDRAKNRISLALADGGKQEKAPPRGGGDDFRPFLGKPSGSFGSWADVMKDQVNIPLPETKPGRRRRDGGKRDRDRDRDLDEN